MSIPLPRWFGPTLLATSALGLGLSTWAMANRLADRFDRHHE